MFKELFRRSLFLNLSFIYKNHSGCHFFCKSHLMCHNLPWSFLLLQAVSSAPKPLQPSPDPTQMSVHQKHHVRFHCQCTDNGNSLLLTTGQLRRIRICLCFRPTRSKIFHSASFLFSSFFTLSFQEALSVQA